MACRLSSQAMPASHILYRSPQAWLIQMSAVPKGHFLRSSHRNLVLLSVACTCRDAVSGEVNQWSKLLAGLEAVRQATRPRGAKTVVVIVHPPDVPTAEVPDDRLAGIIRQSGTERK